MRTLLEAKHVVFRLCLDDHLLVLGMIIFLGLFALSVARCELLRESLDQVGPILYKAALPACQHQQLLSRTAFRDD